MKISRIEHLGIAVQSIEEALPYFENVLGLKCYAVEEVADQKVKTAFGAARADISGEHHTEMARQGQPRRTPRGILHRRRRGRGFGRVRGQRPAPH